MSASDEAIQNTLNDRSISDWLKYALSAARERDCVDAARDAQQLAALLDARRDEILERERNPTEEELRYHDCREAGEHSWWENDAQGIPLCRVCEKCRDAKLSRFRPCILTGYNQSDVDERIEEDY